MVVPPHPTLSSGCCTLFLQGCSIELEPGWQFNAILIYIYIYTHTTLVLVVHGGDLRGMGLRPLPRIPNFPFSTFLPIPLHGLLLRSYGGGWGGKDDPAHREVCG